MPSNTHHTFRSKVRNAIIQLHIVFTTLHNVERSGFFIIASIIIVATGARKAETTAIVQGDFQNFFKFYTSQTVSSPQMLRIFSRRGSLSLWIVPSQKVFVFSPLRMT